MSQRRGFTLMEVLVALAILGISLAVLLQSQAASLDNAGRSRDLTVATLLARGKMIDIEKHLFHDGFQMSTEDEDGDFSDEGHADVKWHYRISEVELDLSALTGMCGSLAKKTDKENASSDCESAMGGLGQMIGGFTDELGRSLRVVDLKVSWPVGKYSESMSVRALLSRDDFATQQESDTFKAINQQTGGQAGSLLGGGGAPAPQQGSPR